MEPRKYKLKNGGVLLIREAAVEDARAALHYVENISGESDFLNFGYGEFELSEAEEEEFLRKQRNSDNQLYILGLIDDTVISTLTFSYNSFASSRFPSRDRFTAINAMAAVHFGRN